MILNDSEIRRFSSNDIYLFGITNKEGCSQYKGVSALEMEPLKPINLEYDEIIARYQILLFHRQRK